MKANKDQQAAEGEAEQICSDAAQEPEQVVGVRLGKADGVQQSGDDERGAQSHQRLRIPFGKFQKQETCDEYTGIFGKIAMSARGAKQGDIIAVTDPLTRRAARTAGQKSQKHLQDEQASGCEGGEIGKKHSKSP